MADEHDRPPLSQPTSLSYASVAAAIAVLAIVVERLLRAANAISQPEPTARAFLEDAFYYFAVARNVAQGVGITADGVTWTNGFHPLWAAIMALLYLPRQSDAVTFGAIYAISAILWIGTALLFARSVVALAGVADSRASRLFVLALMALFLADITVQDYFFNGMETGLYLFLFAVLLNCSQRFAGERYPPPQPSPSRREGANTSPQAPHKTPSRLSPSGEEADPAPMIPRSLLVLGVLLGVTFLARNDAAVLLAPYMAVLAWPWRRAGMRVAMARLATMGGVALLVALPWLGYNVWVNGSIIPQSGTANDVGPYAHAIDREKVISTADNFTGIAMTPVGPGFARLSPEVRTVVRLALFGLLVAATAWSAHGRTSLRPLWPFVVGALLLAAWYFCFNGVLLNFVRYLAPAKLLVMVAYGLVLCAVLSRFPRIRGAAAIALSAGLVVFTTSTTVLEWNELPHMGPEVLRLVELERSLPWQRIGMLESGRTGYRFPNRVLNLDGKVNCEALASHVDRTFLDYLDRADIEAVYFADYFVPWLDATYPGWQTRYQVVPVGGGDLWLPLTLSGQLAPPRGPLRRCAG